MALETASLALREDWATICMLEDAGKTYTDYCQIATFGRNIIKPIYFGKYMFFSTFNGKYSGRVNKLYMHLEDHPPKQDVHFVVRDDCQIEFSISPYVIQRLANKFMPVWDAQPYINFFSGRTSGFIQLLRVYSTSTEISDQYFKKGLNGSFQVFNLYNAHDEVTSVRISDLKPVISDNKFDYLKNEIIHLLKSSGALLAVYENTQEGISKLADRCEAEKQLRGTRENWEQKHMQWLEDGFDVDAPDDFDMAQVDYAAIYQKVITLKPAMRSIVEYIRSCKPARLGEYDYNLDKIHNNTIDADDARKRVFDMDVRTALKAALYTYDRYDIDLEDAFQEACIGTWCAVNRHSDEITVLFPSYASMWQRAQLGRELPSYNRTFPVPVHFRENMDTVVAELFERFGKIDFNKVFPEDLYNMLLACPSCRTDRIPLLLEVLLPVLSIDKLTTEGKDYLFTDHETQSIGLLSSLWADAVSDELLNGLTDKQKYVIIHRFGLYGNDEQTLEEVGATIGVTRERIRQIEKKALALMLPAARRSIGLVGEPINDEEKDNHEKKKKKRKKRN